MSEFQSGTGPTPEEVEQIRARADAASEGPWWPMCMGSEGWNIRNDEIGGTVQERKPLVARVGYGEWEQDKANVAFIVNARSDVPALLAAYDVMKQQRDEAVRSIGRVEALAEKRGGLMGEEIRLALIDSDVSEGVMTDDRIAEIRGRAAYFSGTNDVSVLFVEVDRLREQVAHLEATRIEAWSCPDCAFTFSAEHEDVGGGYSCPACQVDRVEVLIKEAQMTYVGALSGSVTVESLRAALDGKAAAMAANQELTTIECSRPRMSDEYEGAWVRLQNHETITRVLSTAPSSGA